MAEAFFLDEAFLLVTLIPIVSLIHMATCVPVHIEYFSAARQPEPKSEIAKDYTSALTIIAVIAILLLVIVMSLMPHATKLIILGAVTMYVSEKYFDEISRFFEFKKKFNSWFGVQIIRSVWLFAPILLASVGFKYESMFVVVSLPVLILALCLFKHIFKLHPLVNRMAFFVVIRKVPYVLGSALSASCRQMPRVLVTSLFPSLAHVYVSIAQLSQVSSLIFAVKVVVPRRRVSSRRPERVSQLLHPLLRSINFYSCVIATGYLFVASMIDIEALDINYIYVLLLAMLIIESLSLEVFKFNSGLIPWFVQHNHAIKSYIFCAITYFSLVVTCFFLYSQFLDNFGIIFIPATNVILIICLRSIILKRHFQRQ